MRTLTYLLFAGLLLLAAPTTTAEHCDDGGSGCQCPSYEQRVAVDDGTWLDLSTDDTWMLVAFDGHYVFVDGVPVLFSPGLFSVWYYQESNGIEGPQRADEVCDDTHSGTIECDCVIGL